MIPSLAPCFEGSFAPWRDVLRIGDIEAETVPGARLLDPRVTEALIGRFAAECRGGDRRAIVSMWTQWYFGATIIPTTAALLALDRVLPIALADVAVAFGPHGRPEAVILPHDGAMRGQQGGADGLDELLDGHVAPLIGHLSASFDVSSRLLWTNAATMLEWTLGEVSAPVATVIAGARRRLSERSDAAGRRHPMCGAVRYVQDDGESVRRRRLCCLRYLLPGVPSCAGLCPLPEVRLASEESANAG